MNTVQSQSTNRGFLLMLVCVSIFALTCVGHGKVLFYDDFDDGKIDGKYEFKNHPGKWEEKGGVITQTQESPGDHTYLVLDGGFKEPHTGLVMQPLRLSIPAHSTSISK